MRDKSMFFNMLNIRIRFLCLVQVHIRKTLPFKFQKAKIKYKVDPSYLMQIYIELHPHFESRSNSMDSFVLLIFEQDLCACVFIFKSTTIYKNKLKYVVIKI